MIKAEIVAHSLSPQGDELISVLCTFPRIILAEVNTHRMLSKNTSSSRAIPFKKMVEAVQNNPFIPIAWQKYHIGMQGTEYLSKTEKFNLNSFVSSCIDTLNTKNKGSKEYEQEKKRVEEKVNLITGLLSSYVHETKTLDEWWLFARDKAIEAASILYVFDVTKQLCNRLLEPFMWTTMLITGIKEGWDNFFNLRCPQYEWRGELYKSVKDIRKFVGEDTWTGMNYNYSMTEQWWRERNKGQAEIHIMDLAEKIYDAMNESTPKQLQVGQWHIPFENKIYPIVEKVFKDIPDNECWNGDFNEKMIAISTAMAARTSYTVVGEEKEVDYSKMIELHDRLLSQDPPHSSPLEHCARAMSDDEYYSFTKGKIYYPREGNISVPYGVSGWCNNLKGFIPYRYFIDNKIEL